MADMTGTDWLQKNFTEVFQLPKEAADWLCMLFDAIQFFDDVADCDKIERGDFDRSLWNSLVGMNINPFFIKNSYQLLPLISVMILKWQASDKIEREGGANAKSYMWRAGYYDIVLMAVRICHGQKAASEIADKVLALYGETIESYLQEFGHA